MQRFLWGKIEVAASTRFWIGLFKELNDLQILSNLLIIRMVLKVGSEIFVEPNLGVYRCPYLIELR